MAKANENIYKVCLLGECSVGKTSIINRFISGTFQIDVRATIGGAYSSADVYYQDTTYRLGILDTAGQERFRGIATIMYRNAAAAVLVYNIADKKSFDDVEYWMDELRKKAPEDILIFVIGNKLDLESQRAVSRSLAEQYAQENDSVHLEASAKTGEGIAEIFQEICAALAKTSEERNHSCLSRREQHYTSIRLGSSVNNQHGQRENSTHGCRCRTS
ncbi:ras-related protein Rab-5A-like [Diadema setosum]|uniref:ras-related protein Rab-5A-like n=1 Tax=Diadema setosum TaxID=31175 RepID=UPI003B3A99E1